MFTMSESIHWSSVKARKGKSHFLKNATQLHRSRINLQNVMLNLSRNVLVLREAMMKVSVTTILLRSNCLIRSGLLGM